MDIISGIQDYRDAIRKKELIFHMALGELRRRYRRTILGPMWTSLSLAVFLFTLGFLYTNLWKVDIHEYFPYLAASLVIWNPMSSAIGESCTVFSSAAPVLSQIKLPYTLFLFNLLARNLLAMLHMMSVYLLVMIIFSVPLTIKILYFIPALFLLFLNGFWVCSIIAVLCTRYRDLQQVTTSLIQIVFFITPILWMPGQVAGGRTGSLFVNLNPIYHILETLRGPLLGYIPSIYSWGVVIFLAIFGNLFALYVFSKIKNKLIFWL